MTAANWPACYRVTRHYEGGNDDDPHDPGGRTSRGITQREWTAYVAAHPCGGLPDDVWQAPEAEIRDIYRTNYWNVVQGDYWPAGCDLAVWDAGVNSGVSRSKRWAASCLNATTASWFLLAKAAQALADKTTFIHAFYRRRTGFLHGLRTWVYYGRGWARRCATGEALACRMALEASGKLAAPTLRDKAKDARTAAQKAGGRAAGTAAGGALAGSLTDHPVLLALLVAGVLAATAYGLWHWYIHTARAAAMEAVANA